MNKKISISQLLNLRRLCQAACLFAFFVFLFQSDRVTFYAKKGLLTWAISVLPVLLPFIILSKFWIYYNIPTLFCSFCRRPFARHPSAAVSLPVLLLGLSSGFPIGAVFVKHFYENKILSKSASEELLPLCSFVSPMFLMGYIRPLLGWNTVLWGAFVFSLYTPLFCAYLFHLYQGRLRTATPAFPGSQTEKRYRWIKEKMQRSSVREIWISSMEIILTIGIYMMLFTILIGLFMDSPFPKGVLPMILLTNMEITTGLPVLAKEIILPDILRKTLLCGCTSFGGCCTMAQVASVLHGTDLLLWPYLRTKLLTASASALIFAVFCL